MRLHYDAQGNYVGRSQGLSLTCLQIVLYFVFGSVAAACLFIWPFLVFHGPAAVLVQCLYVLFLVICFLLLGRRASNVARRRRERAAAEEQSQAGPGPRDWAPHDDLGRPVG